MKISAFKILLLILVPVLLGFFLIPRLSINLYPSGTASKITVSYYWPGASARAVEKTVTSVLEGSFWTIRGVDEIITQSKKGTGSIEILLKKNASLDAVRFRTASIVRQHYKELPENVSYPIIKVNQSEEDEENPILTLSISAPIVSHEIRSYIDRFLSPQIRSVEGVDRVEVHGSNKQEWLLTFSPEELQLSGISISEISELIQEHYARKGLGRIRINQEEYNLSVIPLSDEVNWRIPIAERDGKVTYLTELATIKKEEQEPSSYYRFNGQNSVTLNVFPEKGVNTLAVAKEIDHGLSVLEESLPPEFHIETLHNATDKINQELHLIYIRSFSTLLILLLLVFVVSRSFNYLLLILASITATMGIAFLLYYFLGVEIQLYSLAGITISFGLIIDNSIVMIDYLRNKGESKIIIPILAATLTTIGALCVIFFLDEQVRLSLIDFVRVIIINLSVSVFVALVVIPALLEKIPLKANKNTAESSFRFFSFYARVLPYLIRSRKALLIVIIWLFGLPFFMLPQSIDSENQFAAIYNKTIGSRWVQEEIRPVLDVWLGGTFRMFSYHVFEYSHQSGEEETKLEVVGSMEKGATVHQMNEAFLQLEQYLKDFPQVKSYISNINSGDYGRMTIAFEDAFNSGFFPHQLKYFLTRKSLDMGGITWELRGVGPGFSTSMGDFTPINFKLEAKGYNYEELNRLAGILQKNLEVHQRIDEVTIRDVSPRGTPRGTEHVMTLNKEKIALLGLHPTEILHLLQLRTLNKYENFSLLLNGANIPFRIESDQAHRFDLWQLKNSPITQTLSIGDAASFEMVPEEGVIYKKNKEYYRIMEFQYNGSEKFGREFLETTLDELKLQLPLGYTFKEVEIFNAVGEDDSPPYLLLLAFVVGIISFISAILFENLKQPLVIIATIPISFIGIFLTYYLFGLSFDLGGMASFVLLSGITVNASIFMLSEYNSMYKRHPHQNPLKLYLEAFKLRAFPIFLTIISTALGFLPFLIGPQGDFWFGLATGTIGGLLFSLVAVLIYLPIFVIPKKCLR